MKIGKRLVFLLAIIVVLASFSAPAASAGEPSVSLGAAAYSAGTLYFPDLTVSGNGIRTILISFSETVTAGDAIVLPAAPAGFAVSGTSNDYAKRINLDAGTTAGSVEAYLRAVGYAVSGDSQTVTVTVTTDIVTADTFYSADTGHYYQYIAAGASGITWTNAYDAAKGMTYMGRTGYLATVTSLDEDSFLNSLSGGKTGWLGGTIMTRSGGRTDAAGTADAAGLYYGGFIDSVDTDGWYWACGPEIGTVFYSLYSTQIASGTTAAEKVVNADAQADADNPGTYYNWARNGGDEPNNSAPTHENCLTTLVISDRIGKHGTSFTWNDIRYDNTDQSSGFSAKGYFVEYGNALTGDSGAGDAAFASASGALSGKPVLTAGAVTRASDTEGTATFTADRPGAYYYAIVEDGAAAPVVDTSGAGVSAAAGENTIAALAGLTAGAKDLYIRVKDSSGAVSDALKIDLAPYQANPATGGAANAAAALAAAAGLAALILLIEKKRGRRCA